MTTTLIIGADRGVGIEVAKLFGKNGHRIILVSRKKEKLDAAKKLLSNDGIDASIYVRDVTDFSGIEKMFQTFSDSKIQIDNLIFNVANTHLDTALSSDVESIERLFKINVLSAINCAKMYLKFSKTDASRTIILTGGGAAIRPSNKASTLSLTKAALRSYAYTLHEEVADKNVFVGLVTIQGLIDTSAEMAADKVAESYWKLYQQRDQTEIFYPEHIEESEFN